MAIDTNIEFEGEKKLQEKLDDYRKNATQAFGAALHERGLAIMATSKKKYVPVDSGRLRQSGFVASPEQTVGGSVFVRVGFGTRYAAAVHEIEDPSEGVPRPSGRGFHWDNGEPKYLKKAIDDHKSDFLVQLAKASEEFIESGEKMAIRRADAG